MPFLHKGKEVENEIWAKEAKIHDGKDRKSQRTDTTRKSKIRNSIEN